MAEQADPHVGGFYLVYSPAAQGHGTSPSAHGHRANLSEDGALRLTTANSAVKQRSPDTVFSEVMKMA